MKERLKKNKNLIILWAVLCCLFLGSAGVLYKIYVKNMASQPKSVMEIGKDGDPSGVAEEISLEPGDSATQNITMVSPEITGITVWVSCPQEGVNISVQLKNQAGKLVKEWLCDETVFPEEGFCYFYLPKQDVELGEIYKIEIRNSETSEANLGLKKTYTGNNQLFYPVTLNGTEDEEQNTLFFQVLDGDCGSIVYFYWLIVALILICITVVIGCGILGVRKNAILVGSVFLAGVLYLLVLPQYTVPDEGSHFMTTYALSSKLLGKEAVDQKNRILLEKESADYLLRQEMPFRETYAHYIRGLLGKDGAITEKTVATRSPLSSTHLGYVPQVLGVTLGRLLHLNGVQIFFLGRLFALFWYCVVMWFAFKIILEFAKNILFLVGSFPMTLQMVASYNYDSVLLGACFLLTAYLLYLAYDEKKEKITGKDIVVVGILLFVIVPIKFVYLPLLGIGLLIPKEKFGGIRQKVIFGGGMLGIGVAAMLLTKLPKMLVAAGGTSSAGNTTQTYSLAMCIKNPLHIFAVFFETIRQNLGIYFTGMIGDKLGWVEIEVPGILIIGYVILMILVVIQSEKRMHLWKKWERIWLVCLVGMIFLIVCAGLMLDYTPSISSTILGIQGRYFLPICIPLLLCCQNSVIVSKRSLDSVVIGSVMVLQAFIALNVMITVMIR